MGWKLVQEVYDYAPDDLTPPEMNLLIAVAWTARDGTREARFRDGQEQLLALSRMSAKQVRGAFTALDARGIRLRVPMRDAAGRPRFRSDGAPLYAAKGHASVLRVPDLMRTAEQALITPAAEQAAHPTAAAQASGAVDPDEETGDTAGTAEQAPAKPVDNPSMTPAQGSLSNGERLPSRARMTALQGIYDSPAGQSQEVMRKSGKSIRARDPTTAAAVDGLQSRTGITITDAWAAAVVAQLLAGRAGIRDPARYVRRAIERDDHPERFLPTPMPPRFRRPDDRTSS